MKTILSNRRAQLGGTLLGLVIGLLVGLLAALIVAVYVTNVPVPFVDRGVTAKPGQDAAEAEHNKGWNPNAGLVGTQEPLPPPTTDGQTGAGPTMLAPGPDADKAAEGEAEQKPPSADPLGDLARDKTDGDQPAPPAASTPPTPAAPPAPATAAATQPFVFFVQVGAFRSQDEASAQRAKVALMGMESQITEREQAGRPVYRVRLGPFNQQKMAEATRDQLTSKGIDAALVRVER